MDKNQKTIARYRARALTSRYLYAWVPYLRFVGLNGSLARGTATAKSDIDLMVVTEPGHIFTVRFLLVGVLALFGIKRNRKRIAGKLCVNYFITTDNLDVKPHNRKVANAYKNMVTLVDSGECYGKLVQVSNKWMRGYKIDINEYQQKINSTIKPVDEAWEGIRIVVEILLTPIADALEIILKNIQIRKINNHPLTAKNSDKIIVSDQELMFHPRK